jgi:hypothetical protein
MQDLLNIIMFLVSSAAQLIAEGNFFKKLKPYLLLSAVPAKPWKKRRSTE